MKKERMARAFKLNTKLGQYEILKPAYELTRIKRNGN